MKGRTPDGREVELLDWQAGIVRRLVDWGRGQRRGVTLTHMGRGSGKTLILTSAAWYEAELARPAAERDPAVTKEFPDA